jgi:hypothetical protein
MFGQIKQEPRIAIQDIVAGAMILLGALLFLIVLHLMTIQTVGDVNSVMNTTFMVFLTIFIMIAIFFGVWIIYKLLAWLVWIVTIPAWKKNFMSRAAKKRQMMQGGNR